MSIPRKYGVLRVIALILKALGWLVLAAGIIGMIALLVTSGRLAEGMREVDRALVTAGVFAAPLIAIVWFVQLFAFGSILSLLIDVEENTRSMAARPPA